MRQRELLLVVVDYKIYGAEERQTKEWHIVRVDALETVDQDFNYRGVGWIFLSLRIDFDVGNNELMVGNCDFETWVN